MLTLIDDYAAFSSLPVAAQQEVAARLTWIEQLLQAGHGTKGQLVRMASAALGVDESSVNRYLAAFRKRGWRGVVDGRGLANTEKGLPEIFKAYVAQLHLQNQRSTTGKEVQRMVVERWSKWRRTGDPQWSVPGYDSPPPATRTGYPQGWSPDNLLKLRPDAYGRATARQGAKEAANFLPSILKTRAGMRFGQVVFFDDQDYDNKVVAPGLSQRTLRPQGFNALEYLSACFMDYSIRLRWWDMEQGQYKTLTGMEATWFVITYLMRHGYRMDTGTTLVVEHGTMNGFANQKLTTPDGHHSLEDAIKAVTHGKVVTARSGLFNQAAFAGMLFRPQSSGNPNFKAPLEGIFNLVRNRFAALPGAVGRNRDEKPAEQYGEDLYSGQLLKVWDKLDDRRRELLRFTNLTAVQFGDCAAAVYQAINARRDHALEGWDRCGFVVPQFRWTPDERSPWLSQPELAELIESQPQLETAVNALLTMPGHSRPANLAPIEVADLHRKELTKLPDHLVPLLIPNEWARIATVKSDRTVQIQDKLLGPEPFHYLARFEGRDSATTLKTGTKLRCYLNPFMTERLIICREDGSYLGVLRQRDRAGFLDQDAIMQQLHERAEIKADLDSAVRPHLQGLIEHRTEIRNNNDRVISGAPVTDEERAAARSEAGKKAHRTAAANRLQGRGNATAWDGPVTTAAAPSAFDTLPDDIDLPEAF